jgi:hypothetical protein
VGAVADITLELRPARARALDSSTKIEVKEVPEGAGTGTGSTPTPNINPNWVFRGDQWWIDNGRDDDTVAEVVRGEDSAEIYVSGENKKLAAVIARAQRKGVHVVDAFKDFYLEHVCFHALLEDLHRSQAAAVSSADGPPEGGATNENGEGQTKAELGRVAETVCGVMEAMFEFIATGAVAGKDD